jgi:hypothetical protein
MKNEGEAYVICIRRDDCEDLDLRKVYRVLEDPKALEDGYLRIIDESGEDYLYPESYFVPVQIPRQAQHAVESVV